MIKKYLFLDIDGVLRPLAYSNAMEKIWRQNPHCKTRDEFGYYFAPWCVDALKYIILMTGAEIVLSSDWRKNGHSEVQLLWSQRRLPGEVIGVTPYLPEKLHNRGEEIYAWFYNNRDSYKRQVNFVILDDRNDILKEHRPFLVQTDPQFGLTLEKAQIAIEILNKKP